jgi:hypothetical protein
MPENEETKEPQETQEPQENQGDPRRPTEQPPLRT